MKSPRPAAWLDARRRARPGAGRAVLLALALLWAQGLGLLHRIAHAPQGSVHVAAAAPLPGVSAHQAEPSVTADTLQSLFGLHSDQSPTCHLYDQLAHGDLLQGAVPALQSCAAALPVPEPAARSACIAPAIQFLARAPPRHA